VIELPAWGDVLVALGLTHVTIAAVTIFLHRHQAHHALDLHPVVGHFFRFWLWLTTGMVTREWVAIHRKHHARCETAEDPHSPRIHGIGKVLFDGVELYRREAKNVATLARYGQGTPDDWIERRLYARHPGLGVAAMLVIDFLVLGPIGLTVWAVQMLWIPLFAAGVINGVGHYWGYRTFAPDDGSTNIIPWGILIGGEELHNNHHAYAASARLSNRWWEFDIGWLYIRALAALRLARVRRVAPRLRIRRGNPHCDLETLRAVQAHRCYVVAQFARLLKRTVADEVRALRRAGALSRRMAARTRRSLAHWLRGALGVLPAVEQEAIEQALRASGVLRTIQSMRQELLSALRIRSAAATGQFVRQLEDWCSRADESGIKGLKEFSRTLRGYA
jgi:stearoyl-CoA desaturase (delta-9 desaturase)